MQIKQRNGIIAVAVTAAVIGVGWYFYSHTKRFYAGRITKFGGTSNFAGLMTMDEGYLKSWSKAIAKGKETFSYDNRNFYTQGGTQVR